MEGVFSRVQNETTERTVVKCYSKNNEVQKMKLFWETSFREENKFKAI